MIRVPPVVVVVHPIVIRRVIPPVIVVIDLPPFLLIIASLSRRIGIRAGLIRTVSVSSARVARGTFRVGIVSVGGVRA